MVKSAKAEPPALSLPDQLTRKLVSLMLLGKALTVLVGLPVSMVLEIAGVSMGSLMSKIMRAWASITAPFSILDLGRTE